MTRRFVSIWFPHLATDLFALRKPELKTLPFVLTVSSHGRLVITTASPLAQSVGIGTGMTLADARTVLPSLLHFDEKHTLTTQLLQRIAEWCIRFTPIAAAQPPDGIVLDASGCTHLWGGDEDYVVDITNRIDAKGYTVKAAVADTIGAAWATSRFGQGKAVVECGRQAEALLSMPPAALRLEAAVLQKLSKLGLRQVKDFISMPRSALRRRFGPLIIQRIDQALGEEEEFIQPVYPIEPYQERLPCLEPIVTRKGIEIGLERLLQTLCNRLTKEGKGLRSAYFRGYRTDGGAQGIEIGTSRPSCNAQHLFHLFSLKIETIEPALGIELFVLEATKVEDLTPQQETFWKDRSGLQDSGLSELIDRIAGKVGAAAIQRYLPQEHHWPERSVKKTSSLEEEATIEWRKDKVRPLSLFTPPEPIEVTAPIPDYPPMNFRYKGTLHKVVKADGPERIEQEWWITDGEHRDYYAVEDEEGCRYWLFRLGHYDADKPVGWFLHGYFA